MPSIESPTTSPSARVDSTERALGAIAVVMSPTGRKRQLWRFLDRPDESIDFAKAHLWGMPAGHEEDTHP